MPESFGACALVFPPQQLFVSATLEWSLEGDSLNEAYMYVRAGT